MKKFIYLILSFTAIFILTSCANKEVVTNCLSGQTYGFFFGIWHGIIAPVDLIISIWRDDVTVFAQNNTGFWYSFGFLIGSGGWGFLGAKGSSRRKHY